MEKRSSAIFIGLQGSYFLKDFGMKEILNKYKDASDVIAVLQDVQAKFGYLSQENLRKISKHFSVSYAYLHSIVSFYKSFSLVKKGKLVIKVCDGTACHIKGSAKILDELYRLIGLREGETTEDGIFTLETVACLGVCAIAPVILINEDYYGNLQVGQIADILQKYKKQRS